MTWELPASFRDELPTVDLQDFEAKLKDELDRLRMERDERTETDLA